MGQIEDLKDVMDLPETLCVSSKPWPRPSLRWAGPGRCADLPWAVTSLESARVSIFLLCFVRAQ